MSKSKVVHFEIPADDLNRANEFYKTVFGWKIQTFDGDTAMVYTTEIDENYRPKEPGAINGDISKRAENFKTPIITIEVDSIEDHAKKIEAAGGKSLGKKVEIPNMGYYAYFVDSEGNTLGLWENLKGEKSEK